MGHLMREEIMKTLLWNGDLNQAARDLLSWLLKEGFIKGALVHMALPRYRSFVPALTRDLEAIAQSWPAPPLMAHQMALVVSRMTIRGPVGQSIAVVLRPCEMAALRELVKLRQAHLDGLLTIGLDCPGVISLKVWQKGDRKTLLETFLRRPEELIGYRPSCKMCLHQAGEGFDLVLGSLGFPSGKTALLAFSPRGEEILSRSPGEAGDLLSRTEALDGLRAERQAQREKQLGDLYQRFSGADGLLDFFSSCINCHSCMRVCPICYCRQCFFDSPAFEGSADNYLRRARRKNGLRLPSDMLLFHLGRMNHMSLSCVSCGQCEDACPAGLPIAQLFSLAAQKSQELFNYRPGRSLTDPLPFSVYQEEELKEVETPYRDIWQP